MSAPGGYSRLQIGLHWAIALLIGYQLVFHDGMEKAWNAVRRGQEYDGSAAQIHVLVGVTVLALALVRLLLRTRRGVPELPEGSRPILDLVAKITHWTLYGLMLAIPLSGIAAWFFGVGTAAGLHGLFFQILFLLVALHTVAALYHQFMLKDGLIRRMMRSG